MTNRVFVLFYEKQSNPGPTWPPDPTVLKVTTSFPSRGICFVWICYGDVYVDLCYIHVLLALLLIWEIHKRELKQFRIKVVAHGAKAGQITSSEVRY